jgi:FAD:protein FMN transferase
MSSSAGQSVALQRALVPRWTSLLPALLVAVSQALSAADLPLEVWEGETMGSRYIVKIAGTNLAPARLQKVKAAVEARLKEVNRQMSHYVPESELSRFNRGPANTPFKISPDFARVMRQSLELNRLSKGAFDPALGTVINLWGFGEKGAVIRAPSEAQLREAVTNAGCSHLRLTPNDELIKDIPGLRLDLGAIAKGYGSDQMAEVLRSEGFTNFYVAISGDVFASGFNARGTNWQVGVSTPVLKWNPGDPLIAILSVSGQGVSTCGDYQKFYFDAQGRRICHVFDPRTGQTVQHNLGSVTVVAPDDTTADGLDTTLFVLGLEEGLKLIEKQTNCAALFIVREPDGSFRQVLSSRFTALTGYKP